MGGEGNQRGRGPNHHPNRGPGPCEVSARGDHTISHTGMERRTVGPRACEVLAGGDRTPSPSLPFFSRREDREPGIILQNFPDNHEAQKGHTSQVVRKVTHFICQSTYFMKSQITIMSESKKLKTVRVSIFLHLYRFLIQI